jgi:HK97 family phage major capsid protein/HK97 family phage prohead protease
MAMPLPTPKDGESQDDFVSRCMSSDEAKESLPDNDQRLAACLSQWREEKGGQDPELELRSWGQELRVAPGDGDIPDHITGYAAVFNSLSEPFFGFRERVMPGAFAKSVSEKDDVRALVDHDPSKILGRTRAGTLTLEEDKHGLRFSILPPDTQAGRDIKESIRRNDVTQMSFAFTTRTDRWLTEDEVEIRELVDVRLFDVSVVTYPAYEDTEVALREYRARMKHQKEHGAAVTKTTERKEQTMDPIEKLRDRVAELRSTAKGLVDKADKESRDLTDKEREEIDDLIATADRLDGDCERRERMQAQEIKDEQGKGRLTDPAEPGTGELRKVTSAQREYATPRDVGRWGWRSSGEFFRKVFEGSQQGATLDPRLEARAPTSFGSEGVGADGGFAVPPDFRAAIMEFVEGEDSLLAMTDVNPTGSNAITYPADIDTPWSSTGIQCFWEGEANQFTQSKPATQQNTVRANKIAALVGMTDELLEDAQAMGPYVTRKAGQKLQFKINLAIVQGNGAGQPLGILNAPCTISVAKVASQTADTITGLNVVTMWSRCYAPSRRRAVWLINQDIEPYLMRLGFAGLTDAGAAATGWGTHAYIQPGGLSGSPYATLLGRPVIPSEACETIGDKGDIILADLNQYCTVTKVGGVKADTSIHLWFDHGVTAFRFVMRIGGQPHWPSTITKRDGSVTLSPFVTLAERA